MSHGIVLNHHSLPFKSTMDADTGVLDFFRILQAVRKSGLKILLVNDDQDKSLFGLELASGYFVRNWEATAKKDPMRIDWCRFLKSIETRQPLFENLNTENIDDTVEVGLFGSDLGMPVLLAAYYFKTFLVSFTASSNWLNNQIQVWVLDLDLASEPKNEIILNLCNTASLEFHSQTLEQRRNELLETATDIWQQRADLFPHITLLANQIGMSLQNWSARHDILIKARDALCIFEAFCEKWQSGIYTDYRHTYLRELGLAAEVSGESESVKNDPKKKKRRMYWLDDGREVYCENHVKLPDGYRLHFYPDTSARMIYIAYLGPHLPI